VSEEACFMAEVSANIPTQSLVAKPSALFFWHQGFESTSIKKCRKKPVLYRRTRIEEKKRKKRKKRKEKRREEKRREGKGKK
jgi:hypothetical protein